MNNPKIAFLILAHKDIKQLNLFINQLLDYENSYIYVHVDKNSNLDVNKIVKNRRVKIIEERIPVRWGDYSQIQTEALLYRTAYDDSIKYDYYSLHSGLDIAIRPIKDFAIFLQKNNKDAYIDSTPMPVKDFGGSGALERIGQEYPLFMRDKLKYKSIKRYIRAIYQRYYIIKPHKKLTDYHFGSAWNTLSSKCLGKIFEYLKNNPDFNKRFYKSLCGDEIYWNTLVNRQKKIKISKTNLRYVIFKEGGEEAGAPLTLTKDNYEAMKKTNNFFARKIETEKSSELIELLSSKE